MSSIYSYQLKPDQNGRIVEKIETIKGKSMRWTYSYDKKGRLSEARLDNRLICQCHYDRQGRRQQDYFPRTHGSQLRNDHYRMDNRLQQAGNNGYTHDKQGFRSIWNHGGKYTLYKYAPDYRLLEAEKPDDKVVFEFTHDDDGQREAKYCNGEMVVAYKWVDFIRLAGFHDGEDGYRFTYDGNERTPYAMQREDGVVAYLYYDQVGSLRVVADQSGNVIKEVLYDPFGGIIEDSNPDLRVPIGFAGGLHDRDLGFVRFGWRDYDTFTGRWTAPDPIGDAGGDPDWYGYCLDDPVNTVDPLGLFLFGGIGVKEYMEAASYLDGISWGGDGRSVTDGPKYGKWGGKNYSGGVDGGKVGKAKPVDSSDEAYKRHDLNYDKIKNTPVLGDVNKTQKKMKKIADKQLVDELKKMGNDPSKWETPPTKEDENSAKLFRKGALFWF